MSEQWVTIFGTNSLSVVAGAVTVRPGLGRHQLTIPIEVRATNDAAHGHTYSFVARVEASGLPGGGGYLGTTPTPTPPRELLPLGKINTDLQIDLEAVQVEEIEKLRNGGFSLNLNIDVLADRSDGAREYGNTYLMNHPVTRDQWLTILEQIRYRRTLLLEMDLPDAQTAPALTKAIEYLTAAQHRFLERENRATVESLRQALAALVGADVTQEDDDAAVAAALKGLRSTTNKLGGPQYADRFEQVRKALKFLTDLGAHPETAETTPGEARATLLMTSGLIQWYAQRR